MYASVCVCVNIIAFRKVLHSYSILSNVCGCAYMLFLLHTHTLGNV